jgi:hypothetical protein
VGKGAGGWRNWNGRRSTCPEAFEGEVSGSMRREEVCARDGKRGKSLEER